MYSQGNKRRCWHKGCENLPTLNSNDLVPAENVRNLVKDFKGGGTKFKDEENNARSSSKDSVENCVEDGSNNNIKEVPSNNSNLKERFESFKAAGLVSQAGSLKSLIKKRRVAGTTKPLPESSKSLVPAKPIKEPTPAVATSTEAPEEEEEYSECVPSVNSASVGGDVGAGGGEDEEEEEYNECLAGAGVSVKVERGDCTICHLPGHDLTSCPQLRCKGCGGSGHAIFSCPDTITAPGSVQSNFSGEFEGEAAPKKEPGVCTPTSSGYWSDDAKEGPYFGKITWITDEKTVGYVEVVLDNGEMKHVHVSGYDVKCGAETGDLVEFVLGLEPDHGRAAKRVKLVEKGLPVSEEDQIRAQSSLKRSLEISAGWVADKKLRADDVIDVKADINAMSDYSDIADSQDLLLEEVKLEEGSEDTLTENLCDHCICKTNILARCQFCPFFFLEATTQHSLLEGEGVTLLAKIQGNDKQKLDFLRQLPYPFRFLNQPKFSFMKEIGRESLVAKISPVFKEEFAFVTVQNNKSSQICLRPGDILGICQAAESRADQVSDHFMLEPPSRQDQTSNIPVYIKKSDFSQDDNNAYCGFASLGRGKMNYKNCLVRISLRPELERKLRLVRSDLTVQISHNVWLELECGRGVFERANIGKEGCIGFASSLMDLAGVEEIIAQNINTRQTSSTSVTAVPGSLNMDQRTDDVNAYDEMLSQIDRDMRSNRGNNNASSVNNSIESLLDRTYKGIVGENVLIIPSKGCVETNLYLQDDDSSLDLKRLLRFQAKVTSNEEFKYFNNCYELEVQTLTIVNGICRASRSTKPCVKVRITNPRPENTCFRKGSPLVLVKIQLESDRSSPKVSAEDTVTRSAPSIVIAEEAAVPLPPPVPQIFNPEKYFQKVQRKYCRKWDSLCAENAFKKSAQVEVKYPYFKNKPKIPFGLKDSADLNMRVGISQDARPVKVLDKINGVFTCTICDVLVLDRYSLQDHWYSPEHKKSMKLVQVIAGLEERLAMNRPVVQDMLDQFDLCPLLGLEHIVEIVKAEENSRYYCSLCDEKMAVSQLMSHLTSVGHNLAFIKKFFPTAWQRFSVIPDVNTWLKSDFLCLEQVLSKITEVHGRKRPLIVEDSGKLAETIEKIPTNSYTAKRAKLESFFRNLKPAEDRPATAAPSVPTTVAPGAEQSKREVRGAVTRTSVELTSGSSLSLTLQLVNVPLNLQTGRFVRVFQSQAFKDCFDLKTGFSKVWSEDSDMFIKVVLNNKTASNAIIPLGSELAVVTM